MIASDKAAKDIPMEMVKELENPETIITVELTYEKP
jgi:hypothetical protein